MQHTKRTTIDWIYCRSRVSIIFLLPATLRWLASSNLELPTDCAVVPLLLLAQMNTPSCSLRVLKLDYIALLSRSRMPAAAAAVIFAKLFHSKKTFHTAKYSLLKLPDQSSSRTWRVCHPLSLLFIRVSLPCVCVCFAAKFSRSFLRPVAKCAAKLRRSSSLLLL